MDMDYKQSLGSHLMDRKDFVAHVAKVRVTEGRCSLPTTNGRGFNCKNLIDQNLTLETIFGGSDEIVTTEISADGNSMVSNIEINKEHQNYPDKEQPKQKIPPLVRHDCSTSDNQSASPQKKRRSIFHNQKVFASS